MQTATMFLQRFSLLISLLSLPQLCPGDHTSQHEATSKLHALYRDFYNWRMEDWPEFSTVVGHYRYNDRVQSFNVTKARERYQVADSFLYEVEQLDYMDLSSVDMMNYRILKDVLQTYTSGYQWSRFGPLNPLNFLEGDQLDPVHKVERHPFNTRGDYENFIARLLETPKQFEEYQELFQTAIDINRTSHNVSVDRVPSQIEKVLMQGDHSPFFHPFRGMLENVKLQDAEREMLRKRGRAAVDALMESFQNLKTFLQTDYLPNTRPGWGVGSLDHGQDFYRACLKWHLSAPDFTPEVVHDIGLREVDRILGLMQKVMDRQKFTGSVIEYFAMLKNDSSLHMESGDEVLYVFKSLIKDRIMPRLSEMFSNLPDLPIKVEPMPYDGPLGQYISGAEDGSRAGIFMVNLYRPRETGQYVMVPITLHESFPGHHLQSSYALKANLPYFRRNTDFNRYFEIPFHFPVYTAYVEGWALYAESLGEELGLYQHDHELMGRYSLEMFRACRLVVDTGLHYYGWDREQAIQYMVNHTSFSHAEMSIEVDRYITWPGQACAYKIGEIKIKELRKRAELRLGSQFDIKAFHSVVLENGPVPLDVLDYLVENWIDNYSPASQADELCNTAAATATATAAATTSCSLSVLLLLAEVTTTFLNTS